MRLLAVAVLAVLLAASFFSPAASQIISVTIEKVTTNGDKKTEFVVTRGSFHFAFSAGSPLYFYFPLGGDYTFTEDALEGWVLRNVNCVGTTSTFTYITGGVTIHYVAGDSVTCTFTNSPRRHVPGPELPPPEPYELCVIELGVVELSGSVSWLPGYGVVDVPISECQDTTTYYTDALGRTIVIRQFIQTGMYPPV